MVKHNNVHLMDLSGVATVLSLMYPGLSGDDLRDALDKYTAVREIAKRPEPCLLTRKEAAERLKVSLPTVNRLLNQGQLVRCRHGKKLVRVTEASVFEFIKNHSVEVHNER